ncbi:sensor histidine kinase [Verticiella sediminum]|uniref:histidine kinase n=1 Tax=Verticiella sediminum TaxID=1247510 RepID=A0A556AY73_9BURK|nr:sensor histidine kinase [Verticiella sediminum]TSH97872.1 sensor histidine kinase [Verticiella sediminum]
MWRRRRRLRLKTTLLGLLVPTVVGLLVFDVWSDYQTLHRTTDEAYDRALLGPALALSNSATQDAGGQVRLEVPQLALAMLESAPQQRVYYRVTVVEMPRGRARAMRDAWTQPIGVDLATTITTPVSGMRDLPLPNIWPAGVEPVFYNSVYRSDPVRVAALSRPLSRSDVWGPQLLVQVAESVESRGIQQAQAWRDKLRRNVVIILVMVGMLLLGVYWALRPLERLRTEIRSRAIDDLKPLDADAVPQEIRPLVQAVNHHVQRLGHVLDAQAQFLADASHQLRTPLAIMRTQVEYALREPGTPRTRQSLDAILAQLERAGRLTAQLLTLAHARQLPEDTQAPVFDLAKLAYDLTVQHLPLAWAKQQDLGWDEASPEQGLLVRGSESALGEAISNVIHNAVCYTPSGGRITVSAHERNHQVEVRVSDTGPGIEPALRERVFERFQRLTPNGAEGVGLGLAIAREFVSRNGGRIVLRDGDPNGQGGHGLCVVIRLRPALPERPGLPPPPVALQ